MEKFEMKCSECGLCNRKGKPSVTKHSLYCRTVRNQLSRKQVEFFQNIGLLRRIRNIWS